MKRLIIATLVGLTAAVAAAQFGPVNRLLGDIYPRDAARAEALKLCMLANPNFNRLDSAARDACYYHAFGRQASLPSPSPTEFETPNQIDLGKSAAADGRVPAGDIRLAQRTSDSPR
jgi:hypothetical protein